MLTVSHFYDGHGGGIERVAAQLCRQFNSLGQQAVWAASDCDEPPSDVEAIPLRCVNPTEKLTGLPMPISTPRGYRALAGAVRRSDAVIIHDALYATSVLAMWLAKKHGKRVVLIQHIAAIPFSSFVLRSLMKLANKLVTVPMLRAADNRVFISDTVRQELLGEPASIPYALLFNGVDSTIFHPVKERARVPEAVGAIDAGAGSRRILFVGRYVEKKGLAVVRDLASSRPDLHFFLAGAGPMQPEKWGLANIHDLGPQTQAELADLYRSADLLLLPSVGEGYPLVIQEAMACGLPVICGEPSNRADPNASGWLRGVTIDLSDSKGSAQRCSRAIDELNFDRDARMAMARYAVENYDWGKMARQVVRLAETVSS